MLRYAPPIYTVIRIEIIFVIIKILILFFSSVISNVSHSRLRIYCLIHTPLSPLTSPLSVCQPPRRGTVRSSMRTQYAPYPLTRGFTRF